ncbi:unnamed protein product [Schistosoma bovis]|nr:unnamed protein product [Schistosoma bovis]
MTRHVVVKQPECIQIKPCNSEHRNLKQHDSQIDMVPWIQSSNNNVHSYAQKSDVDYNDDDDDDDHADNCNDIHSVSSVSDSYNLRCCLLSACCESCTCFTIPRKCDTIYYALQKHTKYCPSGCPTIVPKPEEEEWNLPPEKNARSFAMCQCCYSPGGIICMKYLDILCCPLCPMWDICKGCDYGYRRFRIQVILDRYKDSHKRRYIPCI